MGKIIVELEKSHITKRVHCMLDTYDYKHTLSEYVILIALLLQQCLHKCTSLLLDK